MSRIRVHKTSFAAGEISPWLLGRRDLRAYENGAHRLRNVVIHPAGGVTRRPGLRLVDSVRGTGRLVAFEFNSEQVYLLFFCDRFVEIYRDGVHVAGVATPWTEAQLQQINWTQSADTLLVVHPDVPPQQITRTGDNSWEISDWTFIAENGRVLWPHYKFADSTVTLQPTATSGGITLTASSPVFVAAHIGVRFRIANKEVQITGIDSPSVARADVKQALAGTAATKDWTEQAFSPVRGWPVSVCFHQDRLVIGGTRDLPNRLWLSKAGDLFNFDLGEGLDDEAIEFPILSDQVNAIRTVFSGRHLQVFTSGAEWMVTGEPLTPTSIQLRRQTRVGSPIDRVVPPRDVDGATLFIPRNGPQLREFLFTDTEQAYQSTDLALLAHHLISRPVDMDFDQSGRLLHVVMADGTMATLTVFREEQVSAWTLQETAGAFRSVATVGDATYVLVERQPGLFIEMFDPELAVDCGLSGTATSPRQSWSGLGALEGQTLKVLADGSVQADAVVTGGTVTLAEAASRVQVGLAFKHVIEPLPLGVETVTATQSSKLRPVAVTFRFLDTFAFCLDIGKGPVDVPFKRFGSDTLDTAPRPFSGDKTVRMLGWRESGVDPLWRIEQDTPLPFTLLAVSTEVGIGG